jgi:hypothetical protein
MIAATKRRKRAMPCPNCGASITRADIASFIAKQGAGRKPELQPCEFCHKAFGTAEMRHHIPRCPKNPSARKRNEKPKRKLAA